MGRRENLMCHKTALVYGFSKIDAKFKPNWKFKQKMPSQMDVASMMETIARTLDWMCCGI